MLGWFIVIRKQSKLRLNAETDPNVLATWQASLGGLAWLEALQKSGKAECTSHGGYPTSYSMLADEILIMLQSGLPPQHAGITVFGDDYVTPPGWTGNSTFHSDRIAKCLPGEMLVVDAWDQS